MKIERIIFSIVALIALGACNDDFIQLEPKDTVNNATFWKSEGDLKAYNNQLYQDAAGTTYQFYFGYAGSAWSSGYRGMFWEDCKSDNMAPRNSKLNSYASIAAGNHTIPSTPQSGGWHWAFLRRCNEFLENYHKADVGKTVKGYYAGEVKLWRAWFYFDKVKRFGDVPWISGTLDIDSPELNGERTDRSTVMDSVLNDLNYAVEYMSEEWYESEKDRLNRWTALALKARICLHEGTFRKYHGIAGHEKYLSEAASAAEELIDDGPYVINTSRDYADTFTQLDLTDDKEVILADKYINGVKGHAFVRYIYRANGATKSLVDDVLCTDGKPIELSSVYKGDATIEDEFKNRDPRLKSLIVEPGTSGPYGEEGMSKWWNKIPQPLLADQRISGLSSTTGYTIAKFFSAEDYLKGYGRLENDAPVIRYAEVLLAFAEAKAEIGSLTQADLDKSINKLRDKVGMPHLDDEPEMDPRYDSEGLSSILVEIRRERRIELAFEGYRYDDLLRWKKGSYLARHVLGMRLEDADLDKYPGEPIKRITIKGKTYVDPYQSTVFYDRKFDENKHYLMPLPLSVISKNPKLGQNPFWK